MQLMWLSGPTGQVKSISVTARNMLIAAGALGMALLLLGFALNWVGLRVAVEYNPDLARSLGGVTTEAEQMRMESVYRQNLRQLQASLDQTVQDVKKLEVLKNKFMSLATPAGLKDRSPSTQNSKGGPFVLARGAAHWPAHSKRISIDQWFWIAKRSIHGRLGHA